MVKIENKMFVVTSVVLVFILLMALLSGRIFNTQTSGDDNFDDNIIDIDWEQLYPYDTTVDTESDNLKASPDKSSDSGISNISNSILRFGNLGESWSKTIFKYSEITQLGYAVRSKLIDFSSIKSYIKLKNGCWVNSDVSELSLSDARQRIDPYSSLAEYLNDKGIAFLYCCTPTKECAKDDEVLNGVMLYANKNIDTYVQALRESEIDYMDLRNNLHDDDLDHYSLFFKTDHHWNIDAGIWAASTIEKEISSRYGIYIKNAYDFGTYRRVTYENSEFGPAGQTVTHYAEPSEDMDVLFPEFETNFRLEIPDKGINSTGAFEDLFINYDGIQYEIEKGGGYAYEHILYGNRPYVKITNLNNSAGPKILMIRDSFSIVVAPYLALSCSELVLIDTRADLGNFTGSIINCINKSEPDIVLALQSSPQRITLNK